MKFDIRLRTGNELREHKLELRPAATDHASGGTIEFSLDGASGPAASGVADWVAIAPGLYSIIAGGRSSEVRVTESRAGDGAGEFAVTVAVGVDRREYRIQVLDPRQRRGSSAVGAHAGPQEILAPMPGRIVKVLAAEGQEVEAGSGLVVIEAMKMQNELRAPRSGRVERIYVREGEGVETGAKLVRLGS